MRLLALFGLLALVLIPADVTPLAAAAPCSTPVAAGVYGQTVWCQAPLVSAPVSAVTSANSWVDDFGYTGAYASLPRNYVEALGGGNQPQTMEHFYGGPGGHWHTDISGDGSAYGGIAMRPNQSFAFDQAGT